LKNLRTKTTSEDNIKIYLKMKGGEIWTGLEQLKKGYNGGLL
jgi:hypothetical protein